jgi:endonuclease YncB( thermonuclease family)
MRRAEHAVAGGGVPFVSGIDTPQTHAKCMKERKLALVAKERPKELLAARGLKVMFSGMDLRMQRNERAVS